MENSERYETDKIRSLGIWDLLKKNRFLSRFANFIDPPDPVVTTKKSRLRIPTLLENLGRTEKCLNIGSGSTKYCKSIVNVDLFPMEKVDVIGDAAFLPFKEEIFSLVICQAVLEHVENPSQSVKEIQRVLKKKGIVYVEIPFFQGFHATALYSDYQRYTISGIQLLFHEFKYLEKGVLAGPSSAVAWTLREFLAILFSFNNIYLYRIFNLIFGWLTVPLKYLDYFLEKNRFAIQIASGFFFIGKK